MMRGAWRAGAQQEASERFSMDGKTRTSPEPNVIAWRGTSCLRPIGFGEDGPDDAKTFGSDGNAGINAGLQEYFFDFVF